MNSLRLAHFTVRNSLHNSKSLQNFRIRAVKLADADLALPWEQSSIQMNSRRNHYQVLHVQPDAPTEVIQSSYRTLMQALNAHPDRGGDTSEAARINSAYAVLCNIKKRAEYDRMLKQQHAATARLNKHIAISSAPAIVPVEGICAFCKSENNYKKDIPREAFCGTCKSPLFLAVHQHIEKTGQRKIARIGKQTSLTYYTHWPQLRPHTGVTEDMSTNGLMFRTSQKVAVNSILRIDSTLLQSIACVMNCRQAGNILRPDWRIGVKFLTLHFRSSRGMFISDVG